MEARELMLNDLVMLHDNLHQNRVCRVTGLYGVVVEVSGERVSLLESHLQPIPLTPEIIAKNFEKKALYGIFDDFFDFTIREYNDGMYILNYHCCEFDMPDTQVVGICYIHELQHFLRHVGIDKDIEI